MHVLLINNIDLQRPCSLYWAMLIGQATKQNFQMFLKKVFHEAAVNQHPPVHHSGWMVHLKNEKRKRKKRR
jgi:hypothetical protein